MMSVCIACVAASVAPPKEATVTVAGTDYCDEHGVTAWQQQQMSMAMSPGMSRRMRGFFPDMPPSTPPAPPAPPA